MSTLYDALKKAENKKGANISMGKVKPQEKFNAGDNRKNIQIIFAVVLCVIVAFIVFKISAARHIALEQAKKKAAAKASMATNHLTPEQEAAMLERKKPGAYYVEGIIYNEENPLAVVNGRITKEHDTVGDYVVSKINQDSVELLNSKDNSIKVLEVK